MKRLLTFAILLLIAALAAPAALATSVTGVNAPGAQTPNPVIQGNSATYLITVTFNNGGTCTSNPLTLGGTALPAGASGSFSPPSVANAGGTGTSTLTITTTGSTPAGTTNGLTVTATSTNGVNSCNATTTHTSPTFSLVVGNPVPTITTLSPSSATAGAAAQTLTINGTKFVSTSTATYNGVAHTLTFVSSTQVTIPLTAGDQATGGNFPVVVTNPGPGGGTSNAVNFTVNNLVPTITTLSPSSASAGAGAQTLTINGTNFVATSTATYNGVAHTVTFVNSGQVTIPLTAGDQATAGTYPVVVTNPAPGGGTSNTVNFTVNNLTPTITTLSPTSAVVGAGRKR